MLRILLSGFILLQFIVIPVWAMDFEEALAAAQNGNRSARFNVAVKYQEGDGVAQNPALAVVWYQKAAEGGDANAMFNLAVMYAAGEGVPHDYARAAELFRAAADAGQTAAYSNLGRLYAEGGYGLPQDDHLAFENFQSGAYKGDPTAQYNLGQYYAFGLAVLQSEVKSYAWYKLAADQAQTDAKAAIERLRETLSPTDQTLGEIEAQQLSSQIGN